MARWDYPPHPEDSVSVSEWSACEGMTCNLWKGCSTSCWNMFRTVWRSLYINCPLRWWHQCARPYAPLWLPSRSPQGHYFCALWGAEILHPLPPIVRAAGEGEYLTKCEVCVAYSKPLWMVGPFHRIIGTRQQAHWFLFASANWHLMGLCLNISLYQPSDLMRNYL